MKHKRFVKVQRLMMKHNTQGKMALTRAERRQVRKVLGGSVVPVTRKPTLFEKIASMVGAASRTR